MKRLPLTCFAFIAALGLAATAHAADVGRVLLAAGDTVAIRGNQPVKLVFGAMIQDKDVLRTGSASNLQVRFIDESIVSMKEASELRIDEFQFSGKEDGKERGFFSLLKGGLRTVTGLVGRSNNANYRLSTVTATIGIRGTDYAATLCQGDCRNNDGSPAKDGLYGRTHGISHGTNRIDVSNERDQKSFGINENFYVADARSVVEPLLVAPDFVSNKLEGRKQGGSTSAGSGSGSEQATTGGAAAESRPSTTPEPLPQLQFVATQDLGPQGTPAVLPPPANGFALVSPIGGAFFDADTLTATYNSLNQLTAYSGVTSGSLNAGTIVDAGSLTLANGQVLTWGRWTGNTLVQAGTGGMVAGSPLLFITASGLIDATAIELGLGGVATYTYAGGPNPVDAGGNVGSITSTSATMNFTLQTATLAVAANFPSIVVASVNTGPASFSVSGSGVRSIGTTGGDWVGGLSGTCTGSGCVGGTSGAASGFFLAGTTGPIGYEFAVFDGSLGVTNAGAAVFLNAYLSSSFTPPTAPTIAGVGAFFDAFTVTPDPGDGGGFFTPANMTTVPAGAASNLATPQILTGFTIPPGFNAEPSGGSITNVASTVSGSVIDETVTNSLNAHWGRWTSGTFTDTPSSTTFSANNQFHYLYGPLTPPAVVAAKTGSFPMSMVAGTTPTNQLGQTGTFSTNVLVNFSTQQVAFNTSTFTFPSDTWTFSGGITPIQIRAGQGAFIDQVTTGTCSGSTCLTSTPAVLGKTGIFMGSVGDHLGVAFSARTTSGPTAHAQTAKIFSCAPC